LLLLACICVNSPRYACERARRSTQEGVRAFEPTIDGSLAAIERWAIERALRERGGRLQDVAVALGISRSTLYRKLREYGLAEDTSQPRTRRKTRRRS
jgi:transcriptional regulator of acetoin/glycerol metabolism